MINSNKMKTQILIATIIGMLLGLYIANSVSNVKKDIETRPELLEAREQKNAD